MHGHALAIEDVGRSFFRSGPAWVEGLFALRNRIVGALGLKTPGATSERQRLLDGMRCEVGEHLGLFRVFAKNEQEVVLGEDDRHLNFRVSLFIGQLGDGCDKELVVSTVVKCHNWLGKLYFVPVKHFHRLIVPAMLRGMVRQLRQ